MRPIFVRALTTDEKSQLEQGPQSPSTFTVRRCQILLKSSQGQKSQEIAKALLCSDQAVRQAIHAFAQEGVACLEEKSHARHDEQALLDETGRERLCELIRLSPRTLNHEMSMWNRALLAQQLYQEGYTPRPVSVTVITNVLRQRGITWRRAKQWMRSPDVHYEHPKKDESC